jgi:DNA-binding MarR family transcriptional regulator
MVSPLDPEANVGFLIHDVSRMMRAWFDERAQALGVTRAQWRVLVHLAGREGLNQSALSEILELDTVTLGRHIDRLERDGWLERRRDPMDRRAWQLFLADASRPILAKMEALAADTMAVAMRDIDPKERERFIETLARIKANLAEGTSTDKAAE